MSMKKATDISQKVRDAVWERDGGRCIICESPNAAPNAHIVRRSQGGMGIPENIVTLCAECHREFDEGTGEKHKWIVRLIDEYINMQYSGWSRAKVVYDKWKK